MLKLTIPDPYDGSPIDSVHIITGITNFDLVGKRVEFKVSVYKSLEAFKNGSKSIRSLSIECSGADYDLYIGAPLTVHEFDAVLSIQDILKFRAETYLHTFDKERSESFDYREAEIITQ